MNPSTAHGRVLVDELVRGGVREAVLAPGSRNAPLSLALHAADAAGRLRLHVRIDERSAGFLALGLAKASGIPVVVTCTSGTAAANLHPAVLEADHAGIPLVVLTADRPAELQGTGANQTTDQVKLYGGAVREFRAMPAADDPAREATGWRSSVCRALAAAAGELDSDPGPVHLDIGFREPLVGDLDVPEWLPDDLAGRSDGGPWTQVSVQPPSWSGPFDGDRALGSGLERTLMIVGNCPPDIGRLAVRLAASRGWPLVAEPSSGALAGALPHGVLLLSAEAFLTVQRPQRVVVVGQATLSRAVQALLAHPEVWVDVVATSPRWADAGRSARATHHPQWLEAALRSPPAAPQGSWSVSTGPEAAATDTAWASRWSDAATLAAHVVGDLLADAWPSGPSVAREVFAALPPEALLVVGSSAPVRDLDVGAVPRGDVNVLANRGLAGIDGTVSTAVGAALAYQAAGGGPAYALLGDLTCLHDANGFVLGPEEARPNLAIVVVNNDGGGIFSQLEQSAPAHEAAFERVFGTPHGVDLASLAAATRTPHVLVTTPGGLRAALAPASGLRIVEVRTDRRSDAALAVRLREAVAVAVAG